MASIMAIRDKEGNIIDIPVLQGPSGPQGEQGEQGLSGVYVGSGEMPDEYMVQIDMDGDIPSWPIIPEPTVDDAGLVIKVQEDGTYGLGEGGISEVSADVVTAGTFAGAVQANETAMASLETAMLRNVVILPNDPGKGAEVDYPVGTVVIYA